MSSVWQRVNEARLEEGHYAALGPQCLQAGRNPDYFFDRAGLYRAERYDFEATGDIIGPLRDARNRERFPGVKSFQTNRSISEPI
ncbi:hypothetical protein [Arthrobacter sp. 18067]|uniref:hypothetical protein n=1 Tax=Arthrobacter sp. 18067 TaxID=2681413 RepID=UPI0013597784|nr:hypothetical protein [Arthrobacter sp. 18067]